MEKPTVHDIAREAGVSLATVDRVLNQRPGVRENTVAKVHEAVSRIGYVRDTHAANLARQRQYRFAFVLPETQSRFVLTLREAILEATQLQQADRVLATILPVPAGDPHLIARSLGNIGPDDYDGVAILAPETPQVRDAIAHLKALGLAVVALASDLPNSQRDHFVGINSQKAGRSAGVLMGRFAYEKSGKVLVVTNSIRARDSLERRHGFDSVMAQEFRGLEVLPSIESYDDPDRMTETVKNALKRHDDLVGLYSMGTGNLALLEGLRASGKAGRITVIAHELTSVTRQALLDREMDAVIMQNVGHLVRSALRVLRAKCDGMNIIESQERIRIEVVIRENIP